MRYRLELNLNGNSHAPLDVKNGTAEKWKSIIENLLDRVAAQNGFCWKRDDFNSIKLHVLRFSHLCLRNAV